MEKKKKAPLTEEQKRKKFGNNYDPNFKRKASAHAPISQEPKDIPSHNDWEFYATSEQVAKDLGSIPYNVMSGVKVQLPAFANGGNTLKEVYRPALLRIGYVNTPGHATSKTDGINMAAVQLYTYVRHSNSGAKNYEAADMMMYVLAMRDIYAEFFEIRRVIGLAQSFAATNRYLPDALITACRVDPDSVRDNIAQSRGRLNLLAQKINSFAVPKYFKAFLRSAYIANAVFGDSNSIRGQFYVLDRDGFYTWSTTSSEAGTQLVFTAKPSTSPESIQTRLTRLNSMLDALFLDTDANTMSGDILKAFGDSDLYQVEQIKEDYMVVPVMDEDILAQIENSTFFWPSTTSIGSFANALGTSLNVSQSNQLITFEPKGYIGSSSSSASQWNGIPQAVFFNSHKDSPDYKDNLEWSRLITLFEANVVSTGSTTYQLEAKFTCFGLELVSSMQLFQNENNNLVGRGFSTLVTGANAAAQANVLQLQQLDWHPGVYYNYAAQDVFSVGMDFKVVTVLQQETVKLIHDNACYASFYARTLYSSTK